MLRRYIYNIPFFILFLIICTIVFFVSGKSGNEKIWDSYYTLAVPDGEAEEIINSGIFGTDEIVSKYTTEFRYNDFGTFRTVGLTEIRERFVEGDPRIDRYMKGAEAYFKTTDADGIPYELIYIGSEKSVWDFYFGLKAKAGDAADNWILTDFNIGPRLISMLLFAVCWIYGIFIATGLRGTATAAGIPWIISIMVNGGGILPAACLAFMLFILLIRESYPDFLYYMNYGKLKISAANYFYAAGFIVGFAGGTAYCVKQAQPVLPVILSAASGFICIYIFYSLKGQRVRMQEHRLFFPVSLKLQTADDHGRNKIPEIAAAAAAILIVPMFLLFINDTSPIEVPVPEAPAAQFDDWSWESLDYIEKTYDGMVNTADLLTHAAFQETFMFGGEWGFPREDVTIQRICYLKDENEILSTPVNIRQFTEEWYISIIAPDNKTGLDALLLNQKSPGGISVKSDISGVVNNFNPARYLLICILAVLPITGQFITSLRITVRRKGQEA